MTVPLCACSKKVEKKSESESHSVVSDSLWPHGLYMQSMEFSRPESWSGEPFPSPGALSNPGTHTHPEYSISNFSHDYIFVAASN